MSGASRNKKHKLNRNKGILDKFSAKASFIGAIALTMSIISDCLKLKLVEQFVSIRLDLVNVACIVVVIFTYIIVYLTNYVEKWFDEKTAEYKKVATFSNFMTFASIIVFILEKATEYSGLWGICIYGIDLSIILDAVTVLLLGGEILIGGIIMLFKS